MYCIRCIDCWPHWRFQYFLNVQIHFWNHCQIVQFHSVLPWRLETQFIGSVNYGFYKHFAFNKYFVYYRSSTTFGSVVTLYAIRFSFRLRLSFLSEAIMKALIGERNNHFTCLISMSFAHCVFPPSFKTAERRLKKRKKTQKQNKRRTRVTELYNGTTIIPRRFDCYTNVLCHCYRNLNLIWTPPPHTLMMDCFFF